MVNEKVLTALEYDKVLSDIAKFAVLQSGKNAILQSRPLCEYAAVKLLNDRTAEAVKLLYLYNVAQIPFAPDISDTMERAKVGGTLNFAELLNVSAALRSARIVKCSVLNVKDPSIILLKELSERLFSDQSLENESTYLFPGDKVYFYPVVEVLKARKMHTCYVSGALIYPGSEYMRYKAFLYNKSRNKSYVTPSIDLDVGTNFVCPLTLEDFEEFCSKLDHSYELDLEVEYNILTSLHSPFVRSLRKHK